MTVTALFFAVLREKMNCQEKTVEVEDGATPSSLAKHLFAFDDSLLFAVNDEMVEANYRLSSGDIVAFIPPMAGG